MKTEEDLALERLERAYRTGERDLIIKVDRSDELRVRVAGFAVEHVDGVRRVTIRLEHENALALPSYHRRTTPDGFRIRKVTGQGA